MVPTFHVIVFPLTVPPPASDTCVPVGIVSTSTALVAGAAPLFEYEIVYVSNPPGTAVVGHAVFETCRTAQFTVIVTDADDPVPPFEDV
jgi:hypothetical protein